MCRASRGVASRLYDAFQAKKTWIVPTVGILPPLRGSDVNIVFTVGFAAPKALASPTAKFLSPLRGFVARSARRGRGMSCRQQLSRCSLAGDYDCVALHANDATAGRRRHIVTPFGRVPSSRWM